MLYFINSFIEFLLAVINCICCKQAQPCYIHYAGSLMESNGSDIVVIKNNLLIF